ncbi:MAG: hypothetical protein IPI10_18065 [Bacteroidetes bacterium]|nr:hypothetical protein [Bacteroidota bacterium]
MKRAALFILFTIEFSSCSLDDAHIQKHSWLHGSGYSVGDWLTFDDTDLLIRNDTLFNADTPLGIITKTTRGFIGDNEFEVTSIKTGETGRYHEK